MLGAAGFLFKTSGERAEGMKEVEVQPIYGKYQHYYSKVCLTSRDYIKLEK